jgi:hypothetical protein
MVAVESGASSALRKPIPFDGQADYFSANRPHRLTTPFPYFINCITTTSIPNVKIEALVNSSYTNNWIAFQHAETRNCSGNSSKTHPKNFQFFIVLSALTTILPPSASLNSQQRRDSQNLAEPRRASIRLTLDFPLIDFQSRPHDPHDLPTYLPTYLPTNRTNISKRILPDNPCKLLSK